MTDEKQSLTEILPNLIVLLVLLVLEYWTITTLGSSLALAGDSGIFIGLPFIVSIVIVLLIVFELYLVCGKATINKKVLSLTLLLFLIQMLLIVVMYIYFGVSSGV
jgi:hypothetical protein